MKRCTSISMGDERCERHADCHGTHRHRLPGGYVEWRGDYGAIPTPVDDDVTPYTAIPRPTIDSNRRK